MKKRTENTSARSTKGTPAYRAMLLHLMPQVETISERQKRLFDFLLSIYECKGDDALKTASSQLEEFKARDLHAMHLLEQIAERFLEWWQHRQSESRRANGKKGGRPEKKVLARVARR